MTLVVIIFSWIILFTSFRPHSQPVMATDSSDVIVSFSSLSLNDYVERYEDPEDPQRWERARLRQSITNGRTTGNPFELSNSSTQLGNFISDTLEPSLAKNYQQSSVPEAHEYFHQVKTFCKLWEISEQKFINFKKLLHGNLHFPPLLLLNPCDDHIRPYDDMIQSSTLSYLRELLNLLGLELEDVVILDTFPFFTKMDIAAMSVPRRRVALKQAFDLTVAFIRIFRPPAVVSCQCTTNREQTEEWGWFYDPVACDLSSSTVGAKSFEVKSKALHGHNIEIIQAFHPCYVLRTQEEGPRRRREENLKEILRKVYSPCGKWKERIKKAKELQNMKRRLQENFQHFAHLLEDYKSARLDAISYDLDLKEWKIAVEEKEKETFVNNLRDLLT